MLKTVLSLLTGFKVGLAELVGTGLVAGAAWSWKPAVGIAAVGAAVLVKSIEWDLDSSSTSPPGADR
jgi:hypothetical protein